MALILGIETGTEVCSVSLSQDGKLLSLRESTEGRDHAARLAVFIDEILKGNDVRPEELDAVAVSKGPGSYTGLRIGVATAKGLCYAMSIPLVSVGSLDSLAHVAIEDHDAGLLNTEHWEQARLCPMIDARRMEVYMQLFSSTATPLSPVTAEIITEGSFEGKLPDDGHLICFGDGSAKCREVWNSEDIYFAEVVPSARGLVLPAHKSYEEGIFEDAAYFEPYYLKDFVVTRSTKKLI